jgi:hypothetical protein
MRVLHLDAGREMRGGQWQVLRLIEGLASEGVESTLLARPGSPLLDAVRQSGGRAEALTMARLARLAAGHDMVHAHDSRTHTLAVWLKSARLVVARRVAFAGASGPANALARWKYSRARHYIAVSEFVKTVLVARGVAPAKISVVYDGVPMLEEAHGKSVLAPAYAGDPGKGDSLAIEAARIAGVELKFSDALARDIRDAAMLVYITHSEGLGSGALLAMAAGVPVIASNVGGLPEIVEHRRTGLLVENQPAAIAEAIGELQRDPELGRRLGMEARRRVAENFTVPHMVRRTIEVYRQVLS